MARTLDTGSEHLTAEVDDDGVAVITMNRPERRNALTDDMLQGIARALADFEHGDELMALLRAFTASIEATLDPVRNEESHD